VKNDTKFKAEYNNRMVALSDGVFALTIAILLIASNVPSNFEELMAFVYDIPPFGICIIFIYWIWNEQNRVFQFYNLFDGKMNFLNMLLLFFVLVYVYPLKFLMKWMFTFLGSAIQGTVREDFDEITEMIPMEKVPLLMVIYSIGFICIFLCLYLMHKHGIAQKENLGLNQRQILETVLHKNQSLHTLGVGILSFLFAVGGILFHAPLGAFLSGIVYNLLWVSGMINTRKHNRALAQINE